MRLSLLLVSSSTAALLRQTEGFSFPLASSLGRSTVSTWLAADASGSGVTRTKPMSPEEIKARMGVPEEEAPLKIFSDSLYDDMQQTLLTLEKRVKEGPGSLSMLEVEELCAQANRVAVEMKEFEASRVSGLGNAQVPATTTPPPLATTVPVPVAASPLSMSSSVQQPIAEMEIVKSKQVTDTSDDEGPAYDGKAGWGMARGTRNTYVIPGMDEMSPEEYQQALQQTIIDQQKVRMGAGGYGNRATWDYLNNLSGDKGVLKKDEGMDQP